jgi:hypothetical protein
MENGPFGAYAQRLCELLRAPHDEDRTKAVAAALDGEASRLLRASISLSARRDAGCFFTGAHLAEDLLDGADPTGWQAVADPACGAGDLLLAAARRLPLRQGPLSSLKAWGRVLIGRDLDEELVRTTRVRLALLASARHGRRVTLDEPDLVELLPGIRSGDGRELNFDVSTLVLLNPPFGALPIAASWASGRVSRAAGFTAAIIEKLPPNSCLLAILPDVLRSGSNYERWRKHAGALLRIDAIDPRGQFDAWTDIDVFILRATVSAGASSTKWMKSGASGSSLGDVAEIRVGPVVPHRDPESGPWAPYIQAHDLPLGGRFHASAARRRRHRGPSFKPPFVAVRRTSRPEQVQPRALGVLVEGDESILVENHLLVCRPTSEDFSCSELLDVLTSGDTSQWLDERIRCRHLTVRALRQVPLSSD